MAINSISGYSTTRITGLNSQLDTDSLIQKAMQASQAKYDRIYQSKSKLEWKRDAYTGVNKLISEFSDKYMSVLSKDNVFSQSTYKAYKISISDKYNTYFDIKGTSGASVSNHQITKSTLADYATINGAKYRNRVAGFTGTANNNALASVTGGKALAANSGDEKLSDLKYADGTKVFDFSSASDKLSFSVNGKTFVFNQDATLNTMMSDVSNSTDAKVTMSLTSDNKIKFESDVKGAKTQLSFGNVAGPSAFGKNGAFGINDLNITPESLISESMTLDDIAAATGRDLGFDANGKMSFKINGQTFTFDKTDTLEDVLQTVNDDPNAKVTMTYNKEKDIFMLRSEVTGVGTEVSVENVTGNFFGENGLTGINEDTTTKYQTINKDNDTIASAAAKMGLDLKLDSSGNFKFSVNGVEFSFKSTDSLQKMMSAVNSNKDAKAKLTYSQITDSFVFTSTDTGRDASIKLEGPDGAFGGADSFFGVAESEARGVDATIVIDGETITQSSNTFTLDGIQITLKEAFDAANNRDNLGPAKFTVDQDIDSVVEKMKAFVIDYNKLVSALHSMTTEKIDYNYSPLTDAQKEDMSEKEIEKWETEAKKGILRNDSTIKNLLSDMRLDLFTVVEGTGLSPADIGFSTSKYVAGEYNGQITFDEEAFRAALKKDPDAVANVMAKTSTSANAKTEYKESGLVSRFFSEMSNTRTKIRGTNLKNTNEQISKAQDSMTEMAKKMYAEQERLYAQFARMETLMSQYQSQSNWLSQQLSSL